MATADESHEFTPQEFNFIFGACTGLTNREIAAQCKISEEIVITTMASVFDKTGMSNRVALVLFVVDALNAALQRRVKG